MRKQLISTTLAITIGFSAIGLSVAEPIEVSAATTTQASQKVVEAKADQLIQTAKSLMGNSTYSTAEYKPTAPYKFSCATFIMYIFEKNGVDIGTYNEDYMMQQGTAVARNQLQKGDLVFFDSRGGSVPNHVAMYIGDNKVIQMADSKQNIVITDMDSKPYYKDSYITARRVIPALLPSTPATKGDNIVKLSFDIKDKVKMGSVNNEASMRFTGAGYVNYIYKKNGVNLNATNASDLMKKGSAVSKANLRKGDLVFFNSVKGSNTPSIVAIYAGEQRIIVPNSSGVITRVLLADYYKDHYITARRVITGVLPSTPAATTTAPTATKVTAASTATTGDNIVKLSDDLKDKVKMGSVNNEASLSFTGAGYVNYLYKKNGVNLNATNAIDLMKKGTTVSKANLQKGDLVFFNSRKGSKTPSITAIYAGEQKIIVPYSKGVLTRDLQADYYKEHYITAKRVY